MRKPEREGDADLLARKRDASTAATEQRGRTPP